ncbi:MAG TPA: hypothetical protein DEB46_04430 [Myxococcales bacterium]|nr:hypothetical protein [Myxococcales bacterium]
MVRLLSFLWILMLFAACEEEYTGPAGGAGAAAGNPGAPASGKPNNEIEVVADDAADPIPPFIYQSEGLRDPFEPFIVALTDKRDKEGCPLCLDVSELRLVGLVTGVASPVAVIETRDGLGYFVRRGSEIGAHGGRVVDIREGRVLVRERLQDQLGRISIVDRTLSLRTATGRPKNDSDDDDLSESSTPDEPLSASTPDAELEAIEDEEEDEDTSDDEDLED